MSYHDTFITTKIIPRTSIFNLPFRTRIQCSRVSGWEVWALKERELPEELLGAEYSFEFPLRLDIRGKFIIVDSFDMLPEPEIIIAARALLNYTQQDLARVADVGASTIADFEREARTPIRSSRAKILAALKNSGIKFTSDGVTF